MFRDLDESLAAVLERGLTQRSAALQQNVAITFATPDDQFPPSSVSLPAVNLFLYDIRENVARRSNEWQITRKDGAATRERPPVRVDCSYLITAWSGVSDPVEAIKDEHFLLGEVMGVLLRNRRLPADLLQGQLAGRTPPARAKVIRDGFLQSLGEFWQAMGGKPKAALNYTVTLSVPLTEPEALGPLVQSHDLNVQSLDKNNQ